VGQKSRHFQIILVVSLRHPDIQIDIGKEGILLKYLQEAENGEVQIAE
jgi:hypothetical protein